MKWLIALLTAATGILHILVGFNVVAGNPSPPATSWLLVLNGVGYLVLLVLFWTSSGGRRGTIRWILLAYTLITLIGYFVMGAGFAGGTIPLVIKAIELLLAILLVLDRGSDRVVAPVASSTTTRATTGASTTTTGVGTAATGAALTGAAAAAAAGISSWDDRAATAIDATADRVADTAEAAADEVGEAWDATTDRAGDVVDAMADTAEDAGDAMADTAEDAGDAMGDAWDAVTDRAGDAVDATGAALAGAAAAVGLTDADAATLDEAQLAAEPTSEELRADLEEYLRSFGPGSEFRKQIEYVEGIGPAFGAKLRGAGVSTVLDLMVEGATRRGRKHLSDRSGVAQSQILTWVNHIDLYRIKGVAEEYADLLEQSGVDTVVELAQRNPNNLFKRMNDVNEQKSLVRRTPHLSDVQNWVEQAKNLKRLVHY